MELDLEHVIVIVGRVVEAAGVAVIVLGIVIATGRFLLRLRDGEAYHQYRRELGQGLLLGLELLVAGDIIRTVTTAPSIESAAVLGIIVLVRTFLSWSIQLEVEGRFPWQRPPSNGHAKAD